MLSATTALVSVPVALALGIGAAMYRGSRLDSALNFITLSLVAVPEFLVATLAVLIFAVNLGWLSALSYGADVSSPWQFMRTYALPVMTLCCVIVAQMARMTRAAVIDQLDSAYVEMARLKGVSPVRIVLRHALPNAIGPIVNAVALSLSYLLGGVVIVETIFNYPGIASLMVDAVTNRDMALVQGCTMLFCSAYLGLVLMADLCAILFQSEAEKPMTQFIAKSTPAAPQPVLRKKVSRPTSWLGLLGATVCFIWLMVALFGPWLAPHPVGEVVSDNMFEKHERSLSIRY